MKLSDTVLDPEEIPLYSNETTESSGIMDEETKDSNAFVTNITRARMFAYISPNETATGAAILICPGGGYRGISVENEGSDFALWLNKLGISAFVLYYRMPNTHAEIPLKDAQTAMEIIRERAGEWNIDESKVGIAGFSAGGHLASTAGIHFTKNNRPDFMILIYPVISMKNDITHVGSRTNLMGENPAEEMINRFSTDLQITKDTPPTFILAALDDNSVPVENCFCFYKALQQKNIPSEIHTFDVGGHGFGMMKRGLQVDSWPDVLKAWLKSNALIV